jgi:hypothetical protein
MPTFRILSNGQDQRASSANCQQNHQVIQYITKTGFFFPSPLLDVLGEDYVSTRQLSARIAGSDPAAMTRLAESLPDFLGEARADKPATFEIRLGKALRRKARQVLWGGESAVGTRDEPSYWPAALAGRVYWAASTS